MQAAIVESDILALQTTTLSALRPILARFHLNAEQPGNQFAIDTLARSYAKRYQVNIFRATKYRNIVPSGLFTHEPA